MTNTNRVNGSAFERVAAEMLRSQGFWVHIMTQGFGGQPADLIAVKGRYHALIDCKIVSASSGFPFSRVEPNQHAAMNLFEKRAGEAGWFLIHWSDGVVTMLSHSMIRQLEKEGITRLGMDSRHAYGLTFTEWAERANGYAG